MMVLFYSRCCSLHNLLRNAGGGDGDDSLVKKMARKEGLGRAADTCRVLPTL